MVRGMFFALDLCITTRSLHLGQMRTVLNPSSIGAFVLDDVDSWMRLRAWI